MIFIRNMIVGFDELGVIEGLNIKLASKCGISPDLSGAIKSESSASSR